MNRVVILVTVVSLGAAGWARAAVPSGERGGDPDMREALAAMGALVEGLLRPGAGNEDAPRMLLEALSKGVADPEAMGAIVRWVLEEKPEKVAAAFAEALKTVPPAGGGADAERWNEAARSVIGVLEGLLRDAQTHRRRDGQSALRDLAPLAGAAVPAVVDALRGADPATRERLLRTIRLFAPAAKDVVPSLVQALRQGEPAVRLGAATALGALGPAAREAVPALSSALDDPDPAVRAAAAEALKRIRGE